MSKGISRLEFEDLRKWVDGLSIQLEDIRADLNRSPLLYPGQPGQLKDLRNDIGRLSTAINRIDVDVWKLKEGDSGEIPERRICDSYIEVRRMLDKRNHRAMCLLPSRHSGLHDNKDMGVKWAR